MRRGKGLRKKFRHVFGYGLALILSVLVALSPTVALLSRTLFTVPLPQAIIDLWSIFRSTGRFVWPAVYIIMIFAVCAAAKHIGKKTLVIVIAAVALQGFDISGQLTALNEKFSGRGEYDGSYSGEV